VHRYFVTGTDTDVGKTRVTAALALALRRAGVQPMIVKLVQTGLTAEEEGDAQRAAGLAQTSYRELARYQKAADPWSAALAQGATPLPALAFADTLDTIPGPLVAEGAGGLMTPLNGREQLGEVAVCAGLRAVVAVGLRLGCLNHALLTLEHCERLGLPVAAGVLVERWGATDAAYRADVQRVLGPKLPLLGVIPFAADEAASDAAAAKLFESLVKQER